MWGGGGREGRGEEVPRRQIPLLEKVIYPPQIVGRVGMMIVISNLVIVMNEMITKVLKKDSESDFQSELEEEEEVHGRRYIRARSQRSGRRLRGGQRSGRRLRGGQRGRRRRMGIGRASSSRSRSPIDGGAGGGGGRR